MRMKMTVMMKKKAKSGSGEKFKWENLIAANFPDDENSQQTLIKFNLLGEERHYVVQEDPFRSKWT